MSLNNVKVSIPTLIIGGVLGIVILFATVFSAMSCASSKATTGEGMPASPSDPVLFLAIDTSGSAKEQNKEVFGRATDLVLEAPEGKPVYIYRFDSAPAEVFSEEPPATREDIAKVLNKLMDRSSTTTGTNLYLLFERMEKTLERSSREVRIVVFTDCGFEEMKDKDIEGVKKITKAWNSSDRIESLTFIGVKPGFREQLRDMVEMSDDKLSFNE